MLSQEFVRQILLTVHMIGLALGLGGAAMADVSFARSLRMGDRITPETVVWMRSFSRFIWVGLVLLFMSGAGLFSQHPALYLASPGFRAKMLFVAILTVNGYFLNFYTTARLTTFNFSEHYNWRGKAWKARKLSFIFGAISTVSWYAALGAAEFKDVIHLSLSEYVLSYLLVLGVAITVALMLERFLLTRVVRTDTVDQLTSANSTASPSLNTTIQAPVAPQASPSAQLSPAPLPTSSPPPPVVNSQQPITVSATTTPTRTIK